MLVEKEHVFAVVLYFFDFGGDFPAVFRSIVGFSKAEIHEVSGEDFGRLECVGFGEADGHVVLVQEVVHGIVEPGFVPELHRVAHVTGKVTQERFQALGITLQVGRELEEDDSETPGFVERVNRAKEQQGRLLDVVEALEVRDALVGLDAEAEVFTRAVDPVLQGALGRGAVEGVVDFNGVEAGGVVLQKLPGSEFLRVEFRLPVRVRVSGGAGEEFGHSGSGRTCQRVYPLAGL